MKQTIPEGMERADAYVHSFLMTVFKEVRNTIETDAPAVVRFLVQPEIMKKFNEEERAYMFETYCNLTGTDSTDAIASSLANEEIAEDDNPLTDYGMATCTKVATNVWSVQGAIQATPEEDEEDGYVATDYIPTGLYKNGDPEHD